MASARHSVEIARPIDEVFDFLADGANNPRWQKPVTSTVRVGDVFGVGARYDQSMRHPLGFRVSANYEITALDRPHTLTVKSTSGGPIRPSETYQLAENASGGTTVTCIVEFRPAGAARIVAPLASLLYPLFASEASWVDNARDVLEAAGPHG